MKIFIWIAYVFFFDGKSRHSFCHIIPNAILLTDFSPLSLKCLIATFSKKFMKWIHSVDHIFFLIRKSRSNTIKLDDAAHRNYLCSDLCHQNWIVASAAAAAVVVVCALCFFFSLCFFFHLGGAIFHFYLLKAMKWVARAHVTYHFECIATHKMQVQNLAIALIYCLFGRSLAGWLARLFFISLSLFRRCCSTVVIITHSHTWREYADRAV